MLAPNINDSMQKLTGAYQGILSVDKFANTVQSISVQKLDPDPNWLPPVRTELAELRQYGDKWQLARPDIWSTVLLAFKDYTATFGGFYDTVNANKPTSTQQWLEVFNRTLKPRVEAALNNTKQAQRQYESRLSDFSSILPQLDKSIQKGWFELAKEETQMLKLTEKLGELNNVIQNLGTELNSQIVSGSKDYISNLVKLLYLSTGTSVPIAGLITGVFTIEKSFYDIVKNNEQLISTLNEINEIKAKLTVEALGVALTKSTLQTLYLVEEQYLAARDAIPALVDLWQEQESNVLNDINALQAGATPDHLLDLVTLGVAQTNWKEISEFVIDLQDLDTYTGQPVTIDVSQAQVRPTLN